MDVKWKFKSLFISPQGVYTKWTLQRWRMRPCWGWDSVAGRGAFSVFIHRVPLHVNAAYWWSCVMAAWSPEWPQSFPSARRKTHCKQAAQRRAEQSEVSREETNLWHVLTQLGPRSGKKYKTSNNKLDSYWSKAQSAPLRISPFNINLFMAVQVDEVCNPPYKTNKQTKQTDHQLFCHMVQNCEVERTWGGGSIILFFFFSQET